MHGNTENSFMLRIRVCNERKETAIRDFAQQKTNRDDDRSENAVGRASPRAELRDVVARGDARPTDN